MMLCLCLTVFYRTKLTMIFQNEVKSMRMAMKKIFKFISFMDKLDN